jgi:ADP-heptose:LPS heptosyltransferase
MPQVDYAVVAAAPHLRVFDTEIIDFEDTAALLTEMDLVISVCTSFAHLAGSMGKECWVLLSFNADWRWFLDREDSPWYPKTRLFRQKRLGDWAGVLDEVRAALHTRFR